MLLMINGGFILVISAQITSVVFGLLEEGHHAREHLISRKGFFGHPLKGPRLIQSVFNIQHIILLHLELQFQVTVLPQCYHADPASLIIIGGKLKNHCKVCGMIY